MADWSVEIGDGWRAKSACLHTGGKLVLFNLSNSLTGDDAVSRFDIDKCVFIDDPRDFSKEQYRIVSDLARSLVK